jgi:hypothetical protein
VTPNPPPDAESLRPFVIVTRVDGSSLGRPKGPRGTREGEAHRSRGCGVMEDVLPRQGSTAVLPRWTLVPLSLTRP